LRLFLCQCFSIKKELAQSRIEIGQFGFAEEAFDFDGNLARVFFRNQKLLSAQVYLNVCCRPFEPQRVLSVLPPVVDQRIPNMVVIRSLAGIDRSLLGASIVTANPKWTQKEARLFPHSHNEK